MHEPNVCCKAGVSRKWSILTANTRCFLANGEKYFANGKDVFWAFMGLEKAYDTIDRHGMWQMLRVYGVGGKLLKAVQSFYVDRRARECSGRK